MHSIIIGNIIIPSLFTKRENKTTLNYKTIKTNLKFNYKCVVLKLFMFFNFFSFSSLHCTCPKIINVFYGDKFNRLVESDMGKFYMMQLVVI